MFRLLKDTMVAAIVLVFASFFTYGARRPFTMQSDVYIGLAVTSHNNSVVCSSVFDNVSLISN